ncbi:MAG: prolipoprotein diacylglyceryl transferase [Defluviitaleaceae bacterium]|nr:prolipoprotein diacylglyceryl transferase [Defluviitaleaceae bacterium]
MPPDNVAPDIWFPNLRIYFERVPQHVFSIGNFSIYWYAVFIVLGIAAAYFLAIWYAKRTRQKVDTYTDLLLLGVPMAFVGLRAYYLIFNWDAYRGQPILRAIFDIRGGGLAIYGGIIGALLAGVIMGMVKKVKFTVLADTCAPSLLIGQVIGRFGNFFNREAFGGFTNNPFAMRIRLDQARGVIPPDLRETVITAHGVQYLQVHPTFLYEASFNLLLMIILLIYRPHKKFDGEIILMYLLGYGIIRFFVEGLRTDQLMLFDTGLPVSQLVSIIFAVMSLLLIISGRLWKRKRR